jgi:hypothetical protein
LDEIDNWRSIPIIGLVYTVVRLGPSWWAFPVVAPTAAEMEGTMDPRKFDEMVLRISESLSRRSVVGGTVGASLLTAVGLGTGDVGDDALAKKKHNNNNNNKHKHKHKKKKKKCRKSGQTCVSSLKKKKKKCCNNLLCTNGICVPLS